MDPYITEVFTYTLAIEHYTLGVPPLTHTTGLLFLGGQLGIHFLFGFQDMPLGDGSSWIGQHIRPVAKLRARAVEANKDLANSVVLTDLVIVQNGYHDLNFLLGGRHRELSLKEFFTHTI